MELIVASGRVRIQEMAEFCQCSKWAGNASGIGHMCCGSNCQSEGRCHICVWYGVVKHLGIDMKVL